MIHRIAVIGSGTMGNGIAHSFAQHGFEVVLIDENAGALKKAQSTISKNFERQENKGVVSPGEKEQSLKRIRFVEALEEGLNGVEFVVEAITERYETKKALFQKLDKLLHKEVIVASNTSSISITKLAAQTNRAENIIGMHFMNPVPLMPLVEVIQGYQTGASCTKTVVKLVHSLRKTPVSVKDYPGFVSNRILMPMINEAIQTLFEGVAGVEEIDTIMKLGMSHPMGPLQLADFIGLDVCLSILEVLHQGFGQAKYAPCPLLANMVQAGHLGVKSGIGFYDYRSGQKQASVAVGFSGIAP